jgi:hypothetical protein
VLVGAPVGGADTIAGHLPWAPNAGSPPVAAKPGSWLYFTVVGVLHGARSVGTAAEPTAPGMRSYGRQLDDEQVAAVLTFIRNGWGTGSIASVVERRRKREIAPRLSSGLAELEGECIVPQLCTAPRRVAMAVIVYAVINWREP